VYDIHISAKIVVNRKIGGERSSRLLSNIANLMPILMPSLMRGYLRGNPITAIDADEYSNGPFLSLSLSFFPFACIIRVCLFILSFAPCLSASSSCLSAPIAAGCPRVFCAITDSSVRKRSSKDRRSFTLDRDSPLTLCAFSSSAYNNDPLRGRLTHMSRLCERIFTVVST